MKKHNKKAFTLVELLVTIAIIAILAVVSVVGYSAFTQKARDSVAQQELSQVITLITAEDTENGTVYDVKADGLTFAVDQTTDESFKITNLLAAVDYGTDLGELGSDYESRFTFAWKDDTSKTVLVSVTYTTKDGGSATWDFTKKAFA